MRFLVSAAVAAAASAPAALALAGNWSWADRPFDATWVTQPERTTFDAGMRAPTFDLDRGVFRRSDCRLGAIEVPADGKEHEIKDQPLFDAMAVRVVDDKHVEIVEQNAAKKVWSGRYTLSADARALQLDYEDDRATQPVTGSLTYAREGDVLKGPHLLSGIWRPTKLTSLSASGQTLTILTRSQNATQPVAAGPDPNMSFHLVAGDGRSADGRLDAHPYPLNGSQPGSSVVLSRLWANTLQINRSVNGELVEMSRATVSDDGQTMTLAQVDWVCQAKTIYTLQKKSAP
jgi:hypothetical protein